MERADGARNGKAQSEPRAERVHEPMAPGAVRRTAWVADAGAPVPSVFLGGMTGRMGRHRTRGGTPPIGGVPRVRFSLVAAGFQCGDDGIGGLADVFGGLFDEF